MARFVDRQAEMREMNALLKSAGAHLVAVYGRRQVGKTTFILHWARQTHIPYVYWVARREAAPAARQGLAQAFWRWAYPDMQDPKPPQFDTWQELFEQMARMIATQPLIVIWDEFPYAIESDPSLPSHLQAAWDHLFKEKPITLILAGSHIGMMVDLLDYQAPLYGRITAQFPIEPLPYATLADFFPRYHPSERVATYAVLGGVPAYLERFDASLSLTENIRGHLFRRWGLFQREPIYLISDLVREPRHYENVMRAVASGRHTSSEIAERTGIEPYNLASYLNRLQALGLVERRIPATTPPKQRRTTKRSRYHLRDPYLRFYYRFLEPNLDMIEQGSLDKLWGLIHAGLRAFVGMTAFEELCRQWTLVCAHAGGLPFSPQIVGNDWSKEAQTDVVAIDWQEKEILIGECKWSTHPVSRSVLRELVDKSPLVAPGPEWRVHYALFARSGFTNSARNEARDLRALLVDLETLEADLRAALA